MFFCLHSIKSRLRPGGNSSVLRLDQIGRDREDLRIEIDKSNGFSFVQGKVFGIHHLFNNQPFDYGCFTESCFVGSGIWTLAGSKEILNLVQEDNNIGCLEDCVDSYKPICKVDLPFDYQFPHLTDEVGNKFLFREVDCSVDLNLDRSWFDTGNFDVGEYLEGSMSLYTYTKRADPNTTLAITSADTSFFVYLLIPENDCFDSCSLSRLRLIGVYDDTSFIEVEGFTKDPFISSDYSDLVNEVLEKHYSFINHKIEYLTDHKCFSYCNYYLVEVDGVKIRYNYKNEVWVEGLFDGEYVYTVDIGFIHPLSKELMIWDKNVPVSSGGRFKSRKPIPDLTKIIILKRTNKYTSEPILHFIDSNEEVLRTSSGYLLEYNSEDQRVDIEELSMSLINLLLSQYSYKKECGIEEESVRLDPEILELCKSSLGFLQSLISKQDESFGSIPAVVATYSTYESLYREDRKEIRAFEDGIFSPECFLITENISFINTQVDNRALCWLVYAVCTYVEVTSDTSYLGTLLDPLTSYLSRSVNKVGLLPRYLNSNEYLFSYSSIFVMAMMRAHDITGDTKYIDLAADTYLSLDKYLLLPSSLYSHSYEDVEVSTESLVYGLMYSIHLNKEETKEESLKVIRSRYRSINSYRSGSFIVSRSGARIITNTDLKLKTSNRIDLPSIDNRFSLSPIYIENEESIPIPLLYLLDSSLRYLSVDITKARMSHIIESQISHRDKASLLLLSYCLDNQVVGHDLFKSNSLYDLEHLIFQRRFILEKVLRLPKDYTWFDQIALSKDGVAGSLLYTLSLSLANWYVGMRRFKDGLSLSKAKDKYLYRWGRDLKVERAIQETQLSYSDRIRSYLTLQGITLRQIEEALLAQGISIKIGAREITGIEGLTYKPYSTKEGTFLQGINSNVSTIYVESLGHLTEDSVSYIESLLPPSVKALYEENIFFSSCKEEAKPSYISSNFRVFSFNYEFLCCQKRDACLPIYVRVDLSNTYSFPIYIYGEWKNDEPLIYIQEEYKREALVGVIKPGIESQVIRIEPFMMR